MSYFRRLSDAAFEPTEFVEGAWDEREQHIAPALGLLAHLVEADHAARRGDAPLVLARVSYDILGVIPMEAFEVSLRVLRAGRTIELVEAELTHGGRTAVLLRAWMLQRADTASIAGTTLPHMPPREDLAPWPFSDVWPGRAVTSVDIVRDSAQLGHAQVWLRPQRVLLADEPISARARLLGTLDFANGIATRMPPEQVHYPNVDLTASLFREPVGDWLGFDTRVSFGPAGIGLTESVLSDAEGPLGTSSQTLTVRPRAQS